MAGNVENIYVDFWYVEMLDPGWNSLTTCYKRGNCVCFKCSVHARSIEGGRVHVFDDGVEWQHMCGHRAPNCPQWITFPHLVFVYPLLSLQGSRGLMNYAEFCNTTIVKWGWKSNLWGTLSSGDIKSIWSSSVTFIQMQWRFKPHTRNRWSLSPSRSYEIWNS